MAEETVVQRAQARYQAAPELANHYIVISLVVGAVLILGYFAVQIVVPSVRNVDRPPFNWVESVVWLGVGLALLAPQTLYRVMHALIPFFGRGGKTDA